MTKWLRYDTAKASKLYREIVGECIERLTDIGAFAKTDVLEDTGYSVLDDASIRWDYVRRIIEEEQDTELIPVAAVFFKVAGSDHRHGPQHPPETFPERYIATGYGKKTAGFVIASSKNGHFVVQALHQKKTNAIGKVQARNETLRVGRRAGVKQIGGKKMLHLTEGKT